MRTLWLLPVLCAVAGCASLPPAAGPSADAGLIDRFDQQALVSIASELGYAIVDSDRDSQGRPFLTVEAGEELAFRIGGQSCIGSGENQVCQGVQLAARFADAGEDERFDQTVADVNRTLRPAKLFRVDTGLAYERYLIMDGGVTRENLKTNIEVFVEILDGIFKQLYG